MKWVRDVYCPERKCQVNVRGVTAWKDVGLVEVQVQACSVMALGGCPRHERGENACCIRRYK